MRSIQDLVELIRNLCKEQGTSIAELERSLGFGNGTICQWEKRSKKYPSPVKLHLIADALGVSVEYLIGGKIEAPTATTSRFIGDKIRNLCKEQGTSLAQLERKLGLGNGVIARWGERKPNYDKLSAVASALGVSVAYLTGEEAAESIKNPAPKEGSGEKILTKETMGLFLRELSTEDLAALAAQIALVIAERSKEQQ